MKIALIGYGKMGKAIEQIALSRGHEIVAVVDCDTPVQINSPEFRSANVAIEFTVPSAAEANVRAALNEGVAVVSGTTAWTEGLERVKSEMKSNDSLLWSGNYSLGVNLFFAANRFIAKMMSKFPQYSPDIIETHHIHKLDHPSGTAIMAAEQIIDETPALNGWSEEVAKGKLPIFHVRTGEVPGIHRIKWESDVDSISIEHSAKSRFGFALGAVMAAEWINGRPGFHTIDEMMNEIINPTK